MAQIPNQPPNFAQMVENQLLNMKKRTSQIKGELQDGITEAIAENFKTFYQISQQLTAQIDQRDKTIADIQSKLDKCYNAHPELKIAEEAAAKDAEAKAKKGTAKKV